MRLLTFQSPSGLRLGMQSAAGIVDVSAASTALKSALAGESVPTTLEELCSGEEASLQGFRRLAELTASEQSASWLLAEASLQPGPCVPRQGKIICVGLNYRKHAAESGMAVPESPVLFPKYANSLAASGEAIPLSTNAREYDYEVELALVIGRIARNIRVEEALGYVLGYCNANDLSARDLQFRTNQWLLGKALDKFLPVGPYLVTADEVGDPQKLRLRCWVNGEIRQDSNTADMIFPVNYLVSYLSQYMTLEPGDVIVTGTPEGVIFGKKDVPWLKAGDEVTIEVEGLGRLTNVMR
ncbi:FAA hydrolase family protein [Ktedonosporobacter rubrisoli]|uniref:FAA hydrolase family protein n=1 Tax=Ktedonosporobacter rubrisoli TaxID=2509675 RepID=A0A4P6K4M1_KTERU|nr:fumarylacetoacetate hydrolase family protein [Ktedonosporobacter rubrisoli]QBD83278.1 FAA hydrolase family protein [Ktedonosporobacter rubrisoli]